MPLRAPYDEDENTSPASDFRSRYARETAGMPTNLAAIAARNLAADDAALTRVNAVSRFLPQSSSDFGPLPSEIPTSDLRPPTSLSELHTDDISSRRAAIADQKKLIQVRLGILPPKEAGLAAVVLAEPKERKELLSNYAVLEHEEDNLLREHQINSVSAARAAHENFVRQKHIDTATEFSSMMSHLQDVRKNTRRGTPEREEALLDTAVKFPAAFSTQAAQTIFRQMAKEHDDAATLNAPAGYEKVPSTLGPDGQVHYKIAPAGSADLEKTEQTLKARYGLTLKEIKAPDNIESGNLADGKFVNANRGTHFRVRTKEGDVIIPRDDFEALGGHIGESDKVSPAAASREGGQPPSVPPPTDRHAGTIYNTPKGKLKWTGTGWVQP